MYFTEHVSIVHWYSIIVLELYSTNIFPPQQKYRKILEIVVFLRNAPKDKHKKGIGQSKTAVHLFAFDSQWLESEVEVLSFFREKHGTPGKVLHENCGQSVFYNLPNTNVFKCRANPECI